MRWLLPACLLAAACGRAGFDANTNFIDDALETGFGEGTFSGTRWVEDHVELERGVTSGTFTSRVFDAERTSTWREMRWVPGAPYGKPLPDNGGSESNYRAGNFSMAQNILLVHFEDRLDDSSPELHRMTSAKTAGFSAGKLGRALVDPADSYVYTTVAAAGSPFNSEAADLSWALWAKSTASCPGNAVYMGLENPATGLKPHLWLGCTPQGSSIKGVLGNTWCSNRVLADNDCAEAPGEAVITDGAWHHLAIVKSGHAPGTLTAYVDGALQRTAPTAYVSPLRFDNGVQVAIGAFSEGTYPATGVLDEAAMWRRALTADEVRQLYLRGAQRLLVQVRACAEPTCSGVPFGGPGGDPTRWYTESGSSLKPGQSQSISTLDGRYVQYQVRLETDDPAASPRLYEVELTRVQ